MNANSKKNIPHITVESYLRKKKERPTIREKTSLRYFKFDTKEKTFCYKDKKENPEIKVIHIGKDLKGFEDKIDERDKSYCEWKYGFKVITSIKTYVLFVESEEIYKKWMRGLNFYFNGMTGNINPIQENYSNFINPQSLNNDYKSGRSYSNNKITKPNIFANNNLDFDNDFDNDDLNLINNIMSQNKKNEKTLQNQNELNSRLSSNINTINNKNSNSNNYNTKDNKVKFAEDFETKPRSTSQIVIHTQAQGLSQNPSNSSKRLSIEDRKKLLEEEMSKNKLTGKMMTEFVVNNVQNNILFNENELQPKYKIKEKKKEPSGPKLFIQGADDNGDYNGYNLNWYDTKNHPSNNLNVLKENLMVKSMSTNNTKGDFGTLKQELDREGFYGRVNSGKIDFYTPSPIAATNHKGKNLFENFEFDDELEKQQLINPIFLPENPNVSYQRVPFHSKTKSENNINNITPINQVNQMQTQGDVLNNNLNRKFTFNQNYDQIKNLNNIRSSSLVINGDGQGVKESNQNQTTPNLFNKNQIQQQVQESTINLISKTPVVASAPSENWTDINDDWGMNKKTNLDALLQKTNQNLSLQPREKPKPKLEKNLFDEGTLHIKKSSVASKKVSIENLHFGGGKEPEPFFSAAEEKERISKSPMPLRRGNKKIQSQNESNLELDVSRTIRLDEGEEVNVKRKILGTGDAMNRTFVMNLVVPEQLAKFSENTTDERIKQITDQYLNKTGHAVYTGRPKINNNGEQTMNDLNVSKNMSVNVTNVINTSQIEGNLNQTGNITQYINQEQMMMENPGHAGNSQSTMNQTTVIEMIMKVPDKKAVIRDLKSKKSTVGEHVHEIVHGDEFHTRIQHTYKIESMTYLGDDFHMPVSEIKELPKKEDPNKSKLADGEIRPENENVEKSPDDQAQAQVNNLNISNFYHEQNLGGANMIGGPNYNNHNESINDISHISRQYSHLNIEEVWDASVIIDDDFDFEIK
jgi:hypothetical protein